MRCELVERFGGLTAYTRAPARGLWVDENDDEDADPPVQRDDIVVYEVMAPSLDRKWWAGYRADLAGRFQQKELVIRAQPIELL